MSLKLVFVLVLAVSGAVAKSFETLECTQIQDSQIQNGAKVFLPGSNFDLQPIPANFNCLYKIRAPITTDNIGASARVLVRNGLKGVNDYIMVTEIDGAGQTLNNRTGMPNPYTSYFLIPGSELTIQVVTKSVYMGSSFSVQVEYKTGPIPAPSKLKTGGEMNYFDMASLSKGQSAQVFYVTFQADEPIVFNLAKGLRGSAGMWEGFIIDGTLQNKTRLYRSMNLEYENFVTTTNFITVCVTNEMFFGFVMNPVSETLPFNNLYAEAAHSYNYDNMEMKTLYPNFKEAVQVVNFQYTGIKIPYCVVLSDKCNVKIVSGPPNNSSTVLLDLATAKMPYTFPDLKYFSIINEDCHVEFGLEGLKN